MVKSQERKQNTSTKLGGVRKLKWTDCEESFLRSMYSEADQNDLLTVCHGRSWVSIKLKARKLGLWRSHKFCRDSCCSILLDGSPSALYWIGFILADGHITPKWRLRLALASKDAEHVETFARFIKCPNVKYRSISTSVAAQDDDSIQRLCQEFAIVSDKTRNPPKIEHVGGDALLSLIIGYIDGDGSIKHLSGRKDFHIAMKCHSSWLKIYEFFETQLYRLLGVEPPQKTMSRINREGYAVLCLSNSILLKRLKRKALDLGLPILERKWNNIDLNFVGRKEIAHERRNTVVHLYRQEGLKPKEIAIRLNLTDECTYAILRRHSCEYQSRANRKH